MEWRWQPRAEEWSALIGLARRAIETQPMNAAAWISLSKLIATGDREHEVIAVLEEAAEHLPTDANIRLELALALRVVGRFEAALEQVETALSLAPSLAAAKALRFMLLAKLWRYDAAAKVVEEAAAFDPCEPHLFEYWWARSSGPADFERLISRCNVALAKRAGCANAVYFKAMALAKLGRTEAARDVLSLGDVVSISVPPIPEEFASKEAFLSALAGEIRHHPTLRDSPRGKSTLEGQQTGRLQESDGQALRAMVRLIREAAAEYAIGVEANRNKRQPPGKSKLAVWATLCGAEGRQASHRHPDGWLSGVYYVEAPQDPSGKHGGDLVLGALPEKDGIFPPWGTQRVEPVPGQLVMFPSYVPHATEPSGLQGGRISVAFDVVPLLS